MIKEIAPKMINNESLWNYIDKSLKLQNIDEKYLLKLFDITPKALFNWKNGTANISQDKLAVLCSLFGVTIDEMLEGKFNEDYDDRVNYVLNDIEDIKIELKEHPEKVNDYLYIWMKCKELDPDYDKDNILGKFLLSNNVMVVVNGKEDALATLNLYKKIF